MQISHIAQVNFLVLLFVVLAGAQSNIMWSLFTSFNQILKFVLFFCSIFTNYSCIFAFVSILYKKYVKVGKWENIYFCQKYCDSFLSKVHKQELTPHLYKIMQRYEYSRYFTKTRTLFYDIIIRIHFISLESHSFQQKVDKHYCQDAHARLCYFD